MPPVLSARTQARQSPTPGRRFKPTVEAPAILDRAPIGSGRERARGGARTLVRLSALGGRASVRAGGAAIAASCSGVNRTRASRRAISDRAAVSSPRSAYSRAISISPVPSQRARLRDTQHLVGLELRRRTSSASRRGPRRASSRRLSTRASTLSSKLRPAGSKGAAATAVPAARGQAGEHEVEQPQRVRLRLVLGRRTCPGCTTWTNASSTSVARIRCSLDQIASPGADAQLLDRAADVDAGAIGLRRVTELDLYAEHDRSRVVGVVAALPAGLGGHGARRHRRRRARPRPQRRRRARTDRRPSHAGVALDSPVSIAVVAGSVSGAASSPPPLEHAANASTMATAPATHSSRLTIERV